MTCKRCQDRLYEYLDGTLTRRQRENVEAHLARCNGCRAAYAAERVFAQQLTRALHDATADMQPAPNVVFKVNAGLAGATPVHPLHTGVRMSWIRLHKALSLGIVACVILVVVGVTRYGTVRRATAPHSEDTAPIVAHNLEQPQKNGAPVAVMTDESLHVKREVSVSASAALPQVPVVAPAMPAGAASAAVAGQIATSSGARGRAFVAGEMAPPAAPRLLRSSARLSAMSERSELMLADSCVAYDNRRAAAPCVDVCDTDATVQAPARRFDTEDYSRIYENEFLEARNNPLSTFSIDVDSASYANVRRFITQNTLPPKDAVRIEEMINYFRYDYPQPDEGHAFSITTEAAPCPWNPEHTLVMIGLQGKQMAVSNLPPNNLVFLIDVSGSMDEPNKLPLVKAALRLLVNELRPQDRVAMVVYAGAAGVVLESTPGSDKARILAALEQLQAGGSTAGGAGIQLAYKIAKQNFMTGGNNRVILATDGDFNVGASSDAELVRMIEEKRGDGIYLTVLGFGMGNYKDNKMEQLADKGNGNYAYIDSLMEAKKGLVNEMGGTLLTIANDVKLQIEFNPATVKAYRLIGYENRMLKAEDFNNDKKDAGELGAGHNVTAFYEIVPVSSTQTFASVDALKYQATVPQASDELLTVKFRYKRPGETNSVLLTKALGAALVKDSEPSETFRFASAVAEFGLVLRDSEFKGSASISNVLARARKAKGADHEGYRAEFIRMVEQAELLR